MLIELISLSTALMTGGPDRTVGSWTVWEVVDPIDDGRRAGAAATGEGGRLRVKCDQVGEGIYVEIASHKYLGESVRRTDDLARGVMVRFDDDAAIPLRWQYRAEAAVLNQGPEADAFIARLQTAHRVVIRAKTYEFEDVDLVFDLTESAAAMDMVRAGCAASPS